MIQSIEKLFYEMKPFLCIYLGGAAARTSHMLSFGVPSALMLALVGIFLLALRVTHRTSPAGDFDDSPSSARQTGERRSFFVDFLR